MKTQKLFVYMIIAACTLVSSAGWADDSHRDGGMMRASDARPVIVDTAEASWTGGICMLGSADAELISLSLSYPNDCNAKKMKAACEKNGCKVESGGKHNKCMKSGNVITLIPHTVKPNNTCRDALKKINASC